MLRSTSGKPFIDLLMSCSSWVLVLLSRQLRSEACLSLLFASLATPLYAQNTAVLTKAQMLADFDTLTANVKAISPHLPIKEALWHYDARKIFRALRKNIDTVRSTSSFALLINQALTACQDYHTTMWPYPQVYRDADNQFNLYLPIAYIDGRYVIAKSYDTGAQFIPVGTVITRVGAQAIDQYVAGLTANKVLRFDLSRRKFYSENFYLNQRTLFAGSIRLTLKRPDGRLITTDLPTNKRLNFVHPILDTIRNQVRYWPDHQVIYIKLYRMDKALIPMLQQKLAAFRQSAQPIKRIIIDLRDNTGGNDQVWQSLYEAILPGPLTYPLQLDGLKLARLSAAYLKQSGINPDSVTADPAPLLKPFSFVRFYRGNWQLTPTDSSLHFRGKIIILGNENNYSSGASAYKLAQANAADQIYLIGRPTGMFLGTGYTPIQLTLPHSGLRYRVEPALEVTNVKSLSELMHDRYDVVIPWTQQEVLDRENYQGNTLGDAYLKASDPFIRKALAL